MEKTSYQIPLSIGSSFTYRAEHFFEHAGVKKIVDHLEWLTPRVFRAISISGEARTGKTHFSFFAMERLLALGFAPVLRLAPDLRALDISDKSIPALCIDDAQNLLASEDLVGQFVALYEQVRQSSGVLILFGDRELRSDNPHLQSRLSSLTALHIGAPAREDLQPLLQAIAKQRGLKLKSRDQAFLERRLPSDIAGLEEYIERVLKLSSLDPKRIGLETLKDAI